MKWINPLQNIFHCLADLDSDHQAIKIRGDNHYQLPILTLIFMSLSYHIQCSSNLYNKAQFDEAIKMRDDNPILTTNPNTLFLIFVISYAVFFKPIQ